jgi:hypothetical protein
VDKEKDMRGMKQLLIFTQANSPKTFKNNLSAETNKIKNCGESYKMYRAKRDVKPPTHTGRNCECPKK